MSPTWRNASAEASDCCDDIDLYEDILRSTDWKESDECWLRRVNEIGVAGDDVK